MPPFDIQVFSPSNTYEPPSSRALHWMAATSDPASGSDKAKAAIDRPAATSGRYRACNSAEPASEIAPLPRPCIAKTKSARPSYQASVSRISASARTSNWAAAGTEYRVQPPDPSVRTSARHAASTEALSSACVRCARCSLAQTSSLSASSRCAGSKNGQSRKLRTRATRQFPSNCGFCLAANAR